MNTKQIQEALALIEEIRGLSFRLDESASEISRQKRRVEEISGAMNELGAMKTLADQGARRVDETISELKSLMDR